METKVIVLGKRKKKILCPFSVLSQWSAFQHGSFLWLMEGFSSYTTLCLEVIEHDNRGQVSCLLMLKRCFCVGCFLLLSVLCGQDKNTRSKAPSWAPGRIAARCARQARLLAPSRPAARGRVTVARDQPFFFVTAVNGRRARAPLRGFSTGKVEASSSPTPWGEARGSPWFLAVKTWGVESFSFLLPFLVA